jgi:uncharacterized protein (UPF0276 family)
MTPALRVRRPSVGLLYNQTAPALIAHTGGLVEHLSAMPDRLWFDFGRSAPAGRRFRAARPAIDELRRWAEGRVLAGHGLGLSLPSAMPLDETMVDAVVAIQRQLGGFAWYSEHLNLFVTPKGSVPNAQAGLGLPVDCGMAALALIAPKLRRLSQAVGCRVLLENGSFFTPLPEMQMEEPAFLNALHEHGLCGTLLDLHNLLVNERNGGMPALRYLESLDLEAVEEVHLAGGDDRLGFYADSHSTLTPAVVWDWALAFLPRCRRLRAITFEYQESYFDDIGLPALAGEIERLHRLADACRPVEAELEALAHAG